MDLKRTFLLAFVFIEVVRFVELQTISSSEQLLCPEKLANSSKAPCRISWPLIGLAGDWLEDTDDESEYELPLRLELGIRVFHMLKMYFLRFWTFFRGRDVEVGKISIQIVTRNTLTITIFHARRSQTFSISIWKVCKHDLKQENLISGTLTR